MNEKELKEFIINLLEEYEEPLDRCNAVLSHSYPEIADKIIEKIKP